MRFEVRHVAGALGAELSGVDLRSMDDTDVGDLRALIHEHEVVFFREVWLTEEQHLTLGRARHAEHLSDSSAPRWHGAVLSADL